MIKKHTRIALFIGVLLTLFSYQNVQAQWVPGNVTGPSVAAPNSQQVYYFQGYTSYAPFGQFVVNGGTLLYTQQVDATRYIASVQWSSGNNGSVVFVTTYPFYQVVGSLNVVLSTPPSIPPMPTINNNCDNTVLTRAVPPSGETYYWQDSATGTSTSNSSVSITKTSGNISYLRSYKYGMWSSAVTVNYTITKSSVWYADTDSDGFGDPAITQLACSQPSGYVSNNFDECPAQNGNPLNNGCPRNGDPGSTTKNYIHTITPLIPVTNISQLTGNDDAIKTVTYFDGLGRAIQNVAREAGGNRQDIISPIVYDQYGRKDKNYLPYADASQTQGGSLGYTSNTTLISNIETYYTSKYSGQINASSPNPFSETRFEDSPLNRVLETGAPGETWQIDINSDSDHTTKFQYETNSNNEVYAIDYPGTNQSLSISNYYAEGELLKNTVKNENWSVGSNDLNTKTVFTDKSGKKIAEFSYNKEGSVVKTLKTYYVYSDNGNLVYVLTPKIFSNISGTTISVSTLNHLAFQYVYDIYNRQIEQKVPGKEWEYMVYDQLDRPILTQDKNLKNDGKWLFTKYDAFGRTVYSGLHTNSSSRAQLQTAVDNYISGNTNNLSNIESRATATTNIGG
jgi:hypothetical protein